MFKLGQTWTEGPNFAGTGHSWEVLSFGDCVARAARCLAIHFLVRIKQHTNRGNISCTAER